MIKIKRLIFDLLHPKEWMIILWIVELLWKIKDYDRMQWDYIRVVSHATNQRMSKSIYDVDAIFSEIDDAQRENYRWEVKSDVLDMIKSGATTQEIYTYFCSENGSIMMGK